MNVGIDLIEIERIKKSIKNQRFLKRIFSEDELCYFKKINFAPQSIAANFCVKEAFSKALGTGFRGFSFNEVSVLRNELGAPYIKADGKAKKLIGKNNYKISVSISHTKAYATAIVILEKQ